LFLEIKSAHLADKHIPAQDYKKKVKSYQIFISPAATEILYTVGIVLYICNKHNVNGYKYQKYTDVRGGQDRDESPCLHLGPI
jgi:hypothetical protein